jgi:Tol biopolymer transport system component
MNSFSFIKASLPAVVSLLTVMLLAGCTPTEEDPVLEVPHLERYGIYALDLSTEEVELIASSADGFNFLRPSSTGDRFFFSRNIDDEEGVPDSLDGEICSIGVSGDGFERITNNDHWDMYPASSPDDTTLIFLSSRQEIFNLDLYMVDVDGNNERLFFDSGTHDADVHWGNDFIAFTSNDRIWTINVNGTEAAPLTDPPRAGEWETAPLPYGDYDPRFSPDATRIAFSRMVDATNVHGGYDIFLIDNNGDNEINLTNNGVDGYTQGLASWSHAGDRIVFMVSAISGVGMYDIWMMNADGTENGSITPDYFPATFLCFDPLFSLDDTVVYFMGEWWE